MSVKNPLRALLRHAPGGHDISWASAKILNEPDYAVALLGPSLVETALKELLLARFVTLNSEWQNSLFEDGRNGPLSSFSAKIRLGYALGFYGPTTHSDLEIIRNIRNVFAHAKQHLTFTHPTLYKEANKLKLIRQSMKEEDRNADMSPKEFFGAACCMLCIHLQNQKPKVTEHLNASSPAWGPLP